MTRRSTPSGAACLRALLATLLVLLLVGACATDGGGGLSGPQVGAGLGGGAAGGPAEAEAKADEASAQMTPSLQAAYTLARQRGASEGYAVLAEGGELVAHNQAQALSLWFGERVELAPDQGDWSLGLTVEAFGCVGDMARVEAGEPEADEAQPNLVWQDHGPLSAWYLNGPLGLQQGFEVNERPACVDGADVRVRVAVDGLQPAKGPRGEVVLRDASGKRAMQVDGLYVVDAAGTELPAELVVDGGAVVVEVEAAGAVFPLSIDPVWSQQAKLTSGMALGTLFGQSVGVSGDTAVVGAYYDNDLGTHSGAAYVFARTGNTWVNEAKLTASDGVANDWFGWSVDISGDTVVVGSIRADVAVGDTGAAYVFVRSGGVWSEQSKLVASDGATADRFGWAVSVSGEYAAIGAPYAGGATGAAYVYFRNGSTWAEQAKLDASDGSSFDQLGRSVAIDGDTVVAGAKNDGVANSHSGSAYVFLRVGGGTWIEEAKITASDGSAGDQFGSAVGVSGDVAIIGSLLDDDSGVDSGSAYVFRRAAGSWTEEAKLLALDGAPGAGFGSSVAVLGSTAVVGAPSSGTPTGSGSVYIYLQGPNGWIEEDNLSVPYASSLGGSVAVSGQTAVVGARQSDEAYVFTATNTGDACTQGTDCDSNFCVDGVCCNSACGGNDTSDCQACAAALTGGTDGTCAPVTAGTTCRAATGTCDVAETCDGTATTCPADGYEPTTTVCRSSNGVCDAAETCTGSSAGCPADVKVSAGTECRASNGACDVAEQCDGSSDACPVDVFEPATTVCRGATDVCDVAETCTGSSEACPADAVAPPTAECRASTGSCDPAELCDGGSKACPADVLASVGDPGSPTCTPYLCDGSNATCASTCLLDTDCAAGHYCDGGTCAAEQAPGVACTADNQCGSGFCVDGVCCDGACGGNDPADCQACTAALTGGTDGTCAPVSAGTECRASAGSCDPAETCDGAATACPADALEVAGTECRAAAGACDVAEACDGATPTCPDDALEAAGTTCREAASDCDAEELCDGATADCPADAAAEDGTSCDDGDSCTEGDVCTAGACTPGEDVCGTGGGNATGGAGGTATGGAGGTAPIPPVPAAPETEGGCSCRVAAAPDQDGDDPTRGLAGLLVLGVAAARRRRRAAR